ncbi:DUF4087 domain-containing protein [Motilimonas sp. 1_MG-2023]|uniref:DUF4087 domain-containing protein n=1 Tax=Motilimonas sp. 1_MG-2023 TaxID=3062672 RepID=UPI0026E4323F|nr:DUF4087 domain-containing protein [Motilimonas sp. 1_MG-2023]MDO6527900.1 DUF4087 domain-containing protein [Motilimonas sp. 1_MG-2023]
MRLLAVSLALCCSFTVSAQEIRCGWLENPSPANLWLIDREGSWEISIQGGPNYLDDKSLDLVFEAMSHQSDFVRTNNSYGFSCACLTVDTDPQTRQIKAVYQAKQLGLKQCLEDISITPHIPLRFK